MISNKLIAVLEEELGSYIGQMSNFVGPNYDNPYIARDAYMIFESKTIHFLNCHELHCSYSSFLDLSKDTRIAPANILNEAVLYKIDSSVWSDFVKKEIDGIAETERANLGFIGLRSSESEKWNHYLIRLNDIYIHALSEGFEVKEGEVLKWIQFENLRKQIDNERSST